VDDIFQQRNSRLNEAIKRTAKPTLDPNKMLSRDLSRITCFRVSILFFTGYALIVGT